MSEVYHEKAHFTGHVQGVGFRYATVEVAREFEVVGYVANLPDGRVVVEAEGRKPEVSAFLDAVAEKMHGYIRKVERSGQRRSGEFSSFVIR